jgi:hypothetical protein
LSILCGNYRSGETQHRHETAADVRGCYAASRGHYSEVPRAAVVLPPEHVIDFAGSKPVLPPPVQPKPFNHQFADIPEGKYALHGYAADSDTPTIKFYEVSRPDKGQWAGATFVNELASDDRYPRKGQVGKRILAEIQQDIAGAFALYGQEIGVCGVCGRTLTDEESRARGIGPVCFKKVGL